MHIEFLVEDGSGKVFLDLLLPKFGLDSYRIHSYKGVGRLPKSSSSNRHLTKRNGLLSNLKKLLEGYGKSLSQQDCVFVLFDLDDEDIQELRAKLLSLYSELRTPARAVVAIAIEEMEAWFLGDTIALQSAYPRLKTTILNTYKQDSVCGTWELLARILGHEHEIKDWQKAGKLKSEWAEKITPHMCLNNNRSPSFLDFKNKIQSLNSQWNGLKI